jgi:hypothetical protein
MESKMGKEGNCKLKAAYVKALNYICFGFGFSLRPVRQFSALSVVRGVDFQFENQNLKPRRAPRTPRQRNLDYSNYKNGLAGGLRSKLAAVA